MSESKKRKPTTSKATEKPESIKEVVEKEVTNSSEVTKVKNRTNQKQVVAFGEETFEFLAGETKKLPITLGKAREKFSVFLSKNILTIIN